MDKKRVFVNVAGKYVDPAMITFARQKGAGDTTEIEIYVQGAPEPVTVGKDYWMKFCENHFLVE